MSQAGNPDERARSFTPLPPNARPAWRLRRTVVEVVAAIALVSGIIQVEQRLFPALLSEPDWLAMALYVGGMGLPLGRLGWSAALEVRCAWNRLRWYPEAHRRATVLGVEASELRTTVASQTIILEGQIERLAQLSAFAEQAIWATSYLHRARIVDMARLDGHLVLVAETQQALRVAPGDVFMVVGQEPLMVLGEFRLLRVTAHQYLLQDVWIRDTLWWAGIRQAGLSGTVATSGLVAILAPAPKLDLE